MHFQLKIYCHLLLLFSFQQSIAQAKIQGKYDVSHQYFQSIDNTIWVDWLKEGRAAFSKNGYFGFIDSTGQIICPAIYEQVFPFQDGLARVVLNGKYGCINQQGVVVIPLNFTYLSAFHQGQAIYKQKGSELIGLLDKTGRKTTLAGFDKLTAFGIQNFIYQQDSIIGILSSVGKKTAYYNLRNSMVSKDQQIIHHGSSIYFNENGHPVFPICYRNLPLFTIKEGIIRRVCQEVDRLQYRFMDEELNPIGTTAYQEAYDFHDDFAIVQNQGKWGVIDRRGRTILAMRYQSIYYADNGKFIVMLNGKQGVINQDGKVVIPIKYSFLSYLFKGLYQTSGKVINEQGKSLFPHSYVDISALNDHMGIVVQYNSSKELTTSLPRHQASGSYTLFNENGLLKQQRKHFANKIRRRRDVGIPSMSFPEDEILVKGKKLLVRKPLTHGFSKIHRLEILLDAVKEFNFEIINKEGKSVIPAIYDQIKITGQNLLLVKKKDKWGLRDFSNKEILATKYDDIFIAGGVVIAQSRKSSTVFDFTGQILLPPSPTFFYYVKEGILIKSDRYNHYPINRKGVLLTQ